MPPSRHPLVAAYMAYQMEENYRHKKEIIEAWRAYAESKGRTLAIGTNQAERLEVAF